MINLAIANGDIKIAQKVGIGAAGVVAIVVAVIAAMSFFSGPEIRIDPAVVLSVAQAQGYVSPEEAVLLTDKVTRAQTDLERLRQAHPDWKAEIDAAVEAFNAGDLSNASAAFARVDALMAASRAELREEEARSKYMQATLFHPFEYSKAAPLLCAAAELDGSDVWYWIECGRARAAVDTLERALEAFQKAHDFAGDSEAMSDRAAALDGIGDVRVAQGALDAALAAHEESLGILRGLAAQDPGNAGWTRDLSVSLYKVGDVRRAQGQLDAALSAYEEGLGITRRFAALDPSHAGWARVLSAGLNKVGDAHMAQGQLDAARAAHEESLDIARGLAAQDLGNAGWAHDVAVSLIKVGDVRMAQGELDAALTAHEESLDILRRLAAQDRGNAGWARDVAVSLNKVGDVRVAQGQLDAALTAHEDSLGIARGLAAQDPDNAGRARDVAVSLIKIGDVRMAQGELDAALTAREESLDIARGLAAQDPGNAEWARDLAVSLWRMARIDLINARSYWAEVVERMEDMEAKGILLPGDIPFLAAARQNLQAAAK